MEGVGLGNDIEDVDDDCFVLLSSVVGVETLGHRDTEILGRWPSDS